MSFLNVTVRHNSTDISNIVISYNRTHDLCTAIGTLDLVVVTTARVYDPWDTITIYEDGSKRATFFISEISKDAKTGTTNIRGQDGSKKLTDYFIAESYTVDYYSLTGTWIEQFLTEAGISYSMTGGSGVALSESTSLGLTAAYDQILTLLQYSGWYMYFDEDNTAIIGDLTLHSGNPTSINDTRILSTKVNTNDQMLRNRAVVWGNYDIYGQEQVFADLSVITPWNYDANDLRAVVISNSSIRSSTDANNLARRMLTEFARITSEKTITIEGAVNVFPSDMIFIRSHGYHGSGMITTLSVEMSSKGLITTLILDQRCPRLFAFFGIYDDYVYVGTSGEGVWRKPLESSAWEEYNSGIPSGTHITDLYVNDYILATTTASGILYYKQYDSSWIPYIPSGLVDIVSSIDYSLEATAVACTINHLDNRIVVGYHVPSETVGGEFRGWVVQITASGEQIQADQIHSATLSGEYNVYILDLDTNDINNIITVLNLENEDLPTIVPLTNLGIRFTRPESLEQDISTTILPQPVNSESIDVYEDIDYIKSINSVATTLITQCILPDRVYAYSFSDIGGGMCRATRTKYEPVYNEETETWSVSVSSIYVDGYFDNSYTIGTGRMFGYKDQGNDDEVWFGGVRIDGSLIKCINVQVIFSSSTFAVSGVSTYNITGKRPFNCTKDSSAHLGTDALSSFTSRGGNIWQVYASVVNQFITVSWFKYSLVTGAFSSGTSGTYEIEGDTSVNLDYCGGVFAPTKDGSNIMYMMYYNGAYLLLTNVIGVLYGDNSSITNEVLWSRPSGYTGNLSMSFPVGRFCGDTVDNTYIMLYSRIILYSNPPPGTTRIFGQRFWLCYNGQSLGTYKPFNAGSDADILAFMNNTTDYPGVLIMIPFSSKAVSTPYYTNKKSGNIEFVKLPEFSIEATYNLTSYGYNTYNLLVNQVSDDYGQYIYIAVIEGSIRKLVVMNFAGQIIKIYHDIDCEYLTDTIENGFYTKATAAAFLWPMDGYYYINTTNTLVIKQTGEEFEDILYTPGIYVVEISKPSPTEIYHISVSGDVLPIYQTFTNAIGGFSTITTEHSIYDGRVFDIATPSGFVVESGTIESNNWRYFGIVNGSGIHAFPVTLSGSPITIATLSGFINHLETSNNSTNPYFFVSASGVPPRFYQRNPDGITFVDYSSGLPNADITVIRLDDRL